MAKKTKISISIDEKFLRELDKTIEEYSLAKRSTLIEKWARTGFKKLKEDRGIPLRHEIAPEISKPEG